MNTVTTSRPVNLGQLSTELGGAPLSMTDGVIECYDDTITVAQLQAAVDAHDAQPEPEPGPPEPAPPTIEEVVANLKPRLLAVEQTQDQIIIDALMGDFPPA